MKNSSSSDAFSAIETFAAEIGHFSEILINGAPSVHSAEEGRDVLKLPKVLMDGRYMLPKIPN
jgi:hypothetical protein